jgi:hypothetical protein
MKRFTIACLALLVLLCSNCDKQSVDVAMTAPREEILSGPPPDPGYNVWYQRPDLPLSGLGRYAAYGFGAAGHIYFGGGFGGDGNSHKDLWQIDTVLGSVWTQKANLPGWSRGAAATFAMGDKGYVCAGYHQEAPPDDADSKLLKDLWEYNGFTNTWQQKAFFPALARYYAVGIDINGKGYVGTGRGSGPGVYFNDWWQYNPATDNWVQKANFPGVARAGAIGFVVNLDIGYVGTGSTGSGLLKDLWRYSASTNTWVQKANLPGPARFGAVGLAAIGNGFVAMGSGGSTYLDDFWEYHHSTNSWEQKQDFPAGGRDNAVGGSYGNVLFVGMGSKNFSGQSYNKDFWSIKVQ